MCKFSLAKFLFGDIFSVHARCFCEPAPPIFLLHPPRATGLAALYSSRSPLHLVPLTCMHSFFQAHTKSSTYSPSIARCLAAKDFLRKFLPSHCSRKNSKPPHPHYESDYVYRALAALVGARVTCKCCNQDLLL